MISIWGYMGVVPASYTNQARSIHLHIANSLRQNVSSTAIALQWFMKAINCSYNLLEVFILLQLQSTLNGITCFFADDVARKPGCPSSVHEELVTLMVRLHQIPLPTFNTTFHWYNVYIAFRGCPQISIFRKILMVLVGVEPYPLRAHMHILLRCLGRYRANYLDAVNSSSQFKV